MLTPVHRGKYDIRMNIHAVLSFKFQHAFPLFVMERTLYTKDCDVSGEENTNIFIALIVWNEL